MSRINSIFKKSIALNLRYGSALFKLSRDYVDAFESLLTNPPLENFPSKLVDAPALADLNKKRPKAIAPTNTLLLAGELGETVNAAFPIYNDSESILNVDLQTLNCSDQSPLLNDITLTPTAVSIHPKKTAIIRLYATICEELAIGGSIEGQVVALNSPIYSLSFIIIRLPT